MPFSTRLRQRVLGLASRMGVDEHARRLRTVTDPGMRRDRRDHAALKTIFAVTLARDAHAVDIGANHGATVGEMVRVAPEGRVVAFEPIPALHAELVAAFPTADVRNVALSDETGHATFHYVVSADGLSGLRRRSYPGKQDVREITVRTARLDDELPEDFDPSLIKIDVEGAELQVLRGALGTLERHRPVVVFEHGVGAADHYGTSSGDVWDLFAGVGMRIFDLAGEGPYARDRFEAMFTEPIWNWVAKG
jgi:FkbM family methyltransferase